MKICFTGDLFLGGDLLNKSCSNLISSDLFTQADARVVNLEQSISDSNLIENKCTLYTGTGALKQLEELKITAVNLAHNHIQDKGLAGIKETIDNLESVGISHFGAGDGIDEASLPYWLNDEIAILGYCEYDKLYLKQIEVAGTKKPGVNPLRLEKIKADLDLLPEGKSAILYFHWGMEHVWLPPPDDITLVKKILEDSRVLTVIGMHSHRVQGVVRHAGKTAYMCLGNFLFPNFYISPPVQIAYPSEEEASKVKYTTRQYHQVFDLTYKKWRWVNRVSLILGFCTETKKLSTEFVMQCDNSPCIKKLQGISLLFIEIWFWTLSYIYKLPMPLYKVVWKLHSFEVRKIWRIQIMWFYFKQLGIRFFARKVFSYVGKKEEE